MNRAKPLSGLTVVDFSIAYAGPICARMLSDCGARVIKIEPLGSGDTVRSNSRIFAHFNAGKESIQIDLSSEEGQKLAHRLIGIADVVIENFRPGIMRQFGLDYAHVKEQYPKLVYCSISGFGQSGPNADRGAFAPIAHAASGYDVAHLRAQNEAGERPQASGIMIADMLTGAYAFGAVQTALLGRVSSGLGDHIDITMVESMMMLIPGQQQAAQLTDAPHRSGFLPVATRDGFLMMCVVTDKNFAGLCRVIDREDLRDDPRFVAVQRLVNVAQLVEEIERWSLLRTLTECERALHEQGVPCSRYNTAADLFTDPQLVHRQAFSGFNDDAGAYWVQNMPFQFGGMSTPIQGPVPQPGEHTNTVLSQMLALGQTEIDDLHASAVVQ